MHTGRIEKSTRVLGAPAGWQSEKQGVCDSLAVRDEPTTAGPSMVSAWFPTPEEIKRIELGAPIYLRIFSSVHPPVSMEVGPVPST